MSGTITASAPSASPAGSGVFEAYWMMTERPFTIHRVVVRAIEKYGG